MRDKILCAISAITLLVVVGMIGYKEFNQDHVTVVIDLKQGEDPFVAIKQIVPNDSVVTDVRELNRTKNQYEMTVVTKRQRAGLLEWLRSSSRVENVFPIDK